MATIVGYVPVETIIERVNRFPFKGGDRMWNEEEIKEWIAESIRDIGATNQFVEMTAIIPVEDGRAKLPAGIHDIKEVVDNDLNYSLEDCGDSEFKPMSYKVRGGSIFTDFERGNLFLRYKAPAEDERGLPLVLDNEAYIKGVESYCLERIGMKLFFLGEIDNTRYTLLQRNRSYYNQAARNATRNTNPDRLANLQRVILNPYSDAKRKNRR